MISLIIIAALTLLVVNACLLLRRKKTVYTLVPAALMLITSTGALVLQLIRFNSERNLFLIIITASLLVLAVYMVLLTYGYYKAMLFYGETIVHKGGARWRVKSVLIEEFSAWFDKNFTSEIAVNNKPDAMFPKLGKTLKEYQGCRVSDLDGFIVKEYWPVREWSRKGIRFAFMSSRVRRAFILANQLSKFEIPTPEAVAWAVKRCFFRKYTSCVITRKLTGTIQLTQWLERNISDTSKGAEVMRAYGNLMAMFHANRYSNRDFKHENVMLFEKLPSKIWVVDLDGVSRKFFLSRRRAQKDLMRVGRSLYDLGWHRESDARTFFEAYNAGVPKRLASFVFPD